MSQYKVTVTFERVISHNDPASAIDEVCCELREDYGGPKEGVQITEVGARLIRIGPADSATAQRTEKA